MTKAHPPFTIALTIACLLSAADGSAKIPAHFRSVPVKKLVRRDAPTPIFRPTFQQLYFFEDEWILAQETRYEYDLAGNPLRVFNVEDGTGSCTEYQYDSNGQVILRLETMVEDDISENYRKLTYLYDEKVPTYCIERMGFDWDGSEWIPNYYCETNTISRDNAGNITQIVKALPLGSDMIDAYKTVWGYGADGKADSYAYFMNSGGKNISWELYNDTEYRDIVWDRTDGQMVGEITEMFEGPNRISSATAYFEGEKDGYMFVSYPENLNGGYHATFTTNDPEEVGIMQELLYDGESYYYTIAQYFDEETEEILPDPVYTMETSVEVDEQGNLTAELMYEQYYDNPKELVGGIRYSNTYDDNGNLMETLMSEYYYDEEAFVDVMKFVYSDYIDVTIDSSVKNVVSAGYLSIQGSMAYGEGTLSVYTPDGRLNASATDQLDLSNLPNGIYIVRDASSAIKFKK